ncbi:hypothetical protein [Tsuneonella sp. SYSU-LHT278]|uniref:hypothetical protein n=1 Tax=Tsuneonella sediminis TaxID=3416089 RepID=UPI003F7A7F2D
MSQIYKALVLGAAMIGLALLAVYGLVPEWAGEYGPIALLALFPGAWIGSGRTGCRCKPGMA